MLSRFSCGLVVRRVRQKKELAVVPGVADPKKNISPSYLLRPRSAVNPWQLAKKLLSDPVQAGW